VTLSLSVIDFQIYNDAILRREFKIKVIIIRDNEKMQHCPTLNFNKTSSKFHQRLAEAKDCRGENRRRRLCSYYKDG
jgi:hypothetical protein